LPVATLAHLVLFILAVLMAMLAYQQLFKALKLSENYIIVALLVCSALILMSGNSAYPVGDFLLGRAWQGKALLVGICLPLLFAHLIERYRRPLRRTDFVWLTVLAIASLSLNPVAAFLLPPVIVVFRMLSRRPLTKLVLELGILLLPYAFVGLGIKYFGQGFAAAALDSASNVHFGPGSWLLTARFFFGNYVFSGVFLASLLITLLLARKPDQRSVPLVISVLGVTLLAPWFAGLVAGHITTAITYWRLFWLAVPEVIIPLAIVCLLMAARRQKRRVASGLAMALAIILVFASLWSTSYLFTARHGFSRASNRYKLPPEAVTASRLLPANVLVLAPDSTADYLRNLRPDLQVAYSRDTYMLFNLRSDPSKLRDLQMLQQIIAGNHPPSKDFLDLAKRYRVGAIIIPTPAISLNEFMAQHYKVHGASTKITIYVPG
jgi:hypothetical protein